MFTSQLGLLLSTPGNVELGQLAVVPVAEIEADSSVVASLRSRSNIILTATQTAQVSAPLPQRPAFIGRHEYVIKKH